MCCIPFLLVTAVHGDASSSCFLELLWYLSHKRWLNTRTQSPLMSHLCVLTFRSCVFIFLVNNFVLHLGGLAISYHRFIIFHV
jgi:hypothetical protein